MEDRGEPFESNHELEPKSRCQTPKIDKSAMTSMVVNVGEKVEFDVPVQGEPPPAYTWMINGHQLSTVREARADINEPYKVGYNGSINYLTQSSKELRPN